jgi:hypothetical protein
MIINEKQIRGFCVCTACEEDMLEIAQHFEETSVWFSPVVLIGPGAAAVLTGLFIWLGGLGLRRILVAIAGAFSGGVCAFFITGGNITLAVVSAGLAVFIAIMFEVIFITLLTGALAAALGFAVLVGPYIENPDSLRPYPAYKTQNVAEPLSVGQTVEIVKVYAADFSTEIKEACSQMPVYSWAIITALAIIFVAAGFFFWRLTLALCCATLGTILIFAGVISLLLYKGAVPISDIWRRAPLYAAIFMAMIVFGTIVQLLLCQRIRKKPTAKRQVNKGKEEPEERRENWRTA